MAGKMIVANWKMNPLTEAEARDIAKGIAKSAKKNPKTKVVICPPSLFLRIVQDASRTTQYVTGVQHIFTENQGSFTGEISAAMARSMNVHYVIVGHSERRAMGETDQDVNAQVLSILNSRMMPIVCIGESQRDNGGEYLQFIQDQITSALEGISANQVTKCVIAYEPLWAIGKSDSEAMKGEDMLEMNIFIKKILNDLYNEQIMKKITILYGGSVSPNNAKDILMNSNVGGLLIGRQSLYPDKFGEIIKIAENIK